MDSKGLSCKFPVQEVRAHIEFLFVEIENNFDEIKEKTKLSSNDLAFLIRFIREEVKLVPTEEFEESIEEAESVSPDPKDVLRFGNKILVPYLEQ